ncbi:UDP-4-amino-4,6-dideoxy-N-acetyl-beta-L-altrosamine transaminase [Brevundimonas sp. FT23042]|uniref:UDP-4-amino-4, 6-dideoxy-N-acetyl-beta-L-altrosamine transaminase n=1 Tax=Brevundimonas sp. FT23042 TaxID=3393749 RepID=UPI003B587402
MIPYGRQDITAEDIEAVTRVLESDFLTQGPAVPRFERAVAAHVDVAHALAVNSATSALHIACLALGLGRGDWLWTSPISFVASANCALYCGASVDFVDVDSATGNMSVSDLELKLEKAKVENRLPKIVIPVHLCGQSCDMAGIADLASRFGFKVIEDASHAIGGRYGDDFIGSCRYSDITVFSFHPVKIITTAEGGMVLTKDPDLAERMALLRSHGITRDEARMDQASDGGWYYQQVDLGFNYRMTELQAALGVSQINRLDAYVARRHEIADRYDRLLEAIPVGFPARSPDAFSALHLYPIRVPAVMRKQVFDKLREAGIGVNVHYIPIHLQPYYLAMGFRQGDYPAAEKYYAETISLPMFPTLTDQAQDQVVSAVSAAVAA